MESKPAIPSSIFKAYDIRGIVNETLTDEIVYDIGRAIASEAKTMEETSIVVARDGRLSGPGFVAALSMGMRDAGVDVIDLGRVPTPLLYYATHFLDTSTGVMVTGSHNPPEYNGFKIVIGGETLSGEAIQSLRQRIEQGNFDSGQGALTSQDISESYIERIIGDIDVRKPMKVIVDCGNGVAGELAPRLLKALGCHVTELYCEIDGHFPNHHPDPSQPDNLKDLIAAVEEQGADLGLAFDGDGDRLGVIDSNGQIIWPDRQMMLYAADILARHPGAEIIYDVKCSRHLHNVIEQNGGKPLMWKTGHSLVKAKLKETGDLLAGEMSGHIFFKERWFGFDDALYTAARLLEILSATPRKTGDVCGELPNAINTPELHVHMTEGEHYRFMEQISQTANFEDAQVTTIDGLRADFDDGWGLVRASNTTPVLVMRFEANNLAGMSRIQEIFRREMLKINPTLILPF